MAQRQFRSDDTSVWQEGFGNGTDGVYSPSSGTIGTVSYKISGTEGNSSLTVEESDTGGIANGCLLLIWQVREGGDGAGNWEFNKLVSGSGTGTWTLKYPLCHDYSGNSQAMKMFQYLSADIDSAATLDVADWAPNAHGFFGFFVASDCVIDGNVDGEGTGFGGGSAGSPGANAWGYDGDSYVGAGTQDNSEDPNNGGGGGGGMFNGVGDHASGGGGGSHAISGNQGSKQHGGSNPGGLPGDTYGQADLVKAFLGSGGGGGGTRSVGQPTSNGGKGGGWGMIVAKNIVVTGTFNFDGANGESFAFVNNGGGGGGSGGSVLLKCQTAVLGTNLVTATGGSGANSNAGGGSGGAGRIHIDYSGSVSGTTNPSADLRFDPTIRSRSSDSQIY